MAPWETLRYELKINATVSLVNIVDGGAALVGERSAAGERTAARSGTSRVYCKVPWCSSQRNHSLALWALPGCGW